MIAIIDLTEKTEKSNRTESIRFGSVTKSNRFGSVLQKLAKTEPNRPMLTPIFFLLEILSKRESECC